MTRTLRIPLPFRVDVPRPLGEATDTIRLEEGGTVAVLTVAEGSTATLAATYGFTRSPDAVAAGVPDMPEPYLRLEWLLPQGNTPRAVRGGSRFALYWHGDGAYDGWEWGSNNPPAEPEKRTKAKTVQP